MGKIQTNLRLLVICFFIPLCCIGQVEDSSKKLGKVSKLFKTSKILPVQMEYSNRDLKKLTNDSTYINTLLTYRDAETLDTLPLRIRARGNYRRKNCYFSPVKMKIKKDDAKKTLFKGNKELKLVLPCLKVRDANDDVIKELLAYKLYEVVSPYHFKTRLLDFTLSESKGKKIEKHRIKAFFIEDMDELEDRFGGKTMKRNVHPLQQDSLSSIRNSFFQYMIGNTDFSTGYQHNQKLLFLNGFSIPIPYDFDMSGLCDTSYSVVSQIDGLVLPLESVTDRLYRGFKRSNATMFSIRDEFLQNRSNMMAILEDHKTYFENPDEYQKSKKYILGFFDILADSDKFKSEILDNRRDK
ncbi:hypothetical protein SB49_10580 [Sediminicola sp. YIK13]|uniref:hypothetical protein n=1 Tax=Sediminicola sp. YIK13 TaxID=1453352 RepID=UPI00071F675B|nr:hypothetical protein [Sediminicola sp. YIK13]ALM08199.1 hypothetical protein SB49_10580 [Sediminicola sp. YIK13]